MTAFKAYMIAPSADGRDNLARAYAVWRHKNGNPIDFNSMRGVQGQAPSGDPTQDPQRKAAVAQNWGNYVQQMNPKQTQAPQTQAQLPNGNQTANVNQPAATQAPAKTAGSGQTVVNQVSAMIDSGLKGKALQDAIIKAYPKGGQSYIEHFKKSNPDLFSEPKPEKKEIPNWNSPEFRKQATESTINAVKEDNQRTEAEDKAKTEKFVSAAKAAGIPEELVGMLTEGGDKSGKAAYYLRHKPELLNELVNGLSEEQHKEIDAITNLQKKRELKLKYVSQQLIDKMVQLRNSPSDKK